MANPRRRRQAKLKRLAQIEAARTPAPAPAAPEPVKAATPKAAAPAKKTTRTRKSTTASKTTKKQLICFKIYYLPRGNEMAKRPYHDFLDRLTKRFIVTEGEMPATTIFTNNQAQSEAVSNMKPRTQTEARRIAMARLQLKEIKKHARKLSERVDILEEKLHVLEEQKEAKK